MEKSLFFSILCVGFVLLGSVNSFPIDISSVSEGVSSPIWLTTYFFTGFGFFLIIVSIIFGCVCCRNGKGFKEFRNSSGNLVVSPSDGFANPTLNSELTIFPPLGANANEIHRFEPLPDIKSQVPNLRPAAFSYTEQEISSQDWFVDPNSNFPRNQLKYLQEYGRGWFGRVVEGEAQNITPEEKVTKVMVKILHEDATPTDHMYFLHEVKFCRDLKHPNILHLLGRCLETEPFLIILECYSNGDLKTFLSQNLASAQALVEQGVTLQMCSNITSGLQFMHDNKFIHTDLAARNCLVGPDLSIKIGDYGNSIEVFKSDYYCAGSVALPIRWCAPETLKCTDITIETREVTPPANIWSLGVVFWEICEFCKLPYAELNDDEVIVHVLGEKNYFLDQPNMICLHKEELYHLMRLCWKPPIQRPTALQIFVVLNNLISSSNLTQKVHTDSKQISQDFEHRWQNSKPNTIPRTDNEIEVDHSVPIDCNIMPLKLKNAKVVDSSYVDSPLGKFMSNKNADQKSPRFSLKFDKNSVFNIEKNRPLETPGCGDCKNSSKGIVVDSEDSILTKSISKIEFDFTSEPKSSKVVEEIREVEPGIDSWLKGVEINNEEDESFVRKISEAIRDLDETLALEKTSSSEESSEKSSRQNSPGKDFQNTNNPVDFKLGNDTSSFINFTQKTFELTSLQNSSQPQSLNFTGPFNDKKIEGSENYESGSLIIPFIKDSVNKCRGDILYESLKENDSYLCGQSRNSSDTDDEVWRRRIEKGEISEKVKEKSKSIANLMILTHIDSDDSDIDFEKPFEKGINRNSFSRRSGSFAKSLLPNNCGSESDLTFAVLEDDFKESLKKLTSDHKEHGHFDSLGVILPSSANRENVWENLFKSSNPFKDTVNEAFVSEPNTNEYVKDSKSETEEFTKKNIPAENKQDGNNFLGNVASENAENSKILEKDNDLLSECSSEHLVNKKKLMNNVVNDFLTKEHLNFDGPLFMNDPQTSSHLKNGVESINITENNKSSFSKGNHNTAVRSNENRESNFLDDKIFTCDGENCDRIAEGEKLSLKISPNPLEFNEGKNESDLCKGMALTEPTNEKDVKTTEKLLKSDNSNVEDSKSILKENFLPEIKISEEWNNELNEDEQEEFKFETAKPKAFKFVLKDDDFEKLNKAKIKSDLGKTFFTENFICKIDKGDLREKSTVIVGACEDFTMDYFKGLKTTSGDLKIDIVEDVEEYQNDEDIDVWNKHLEKAFTQQLNNANFDEINFKSFRLDCFDHQERNQTSSQFTKFNTSSCPIESTKEFIKNEKLHTEKVEEPIHLNHLTSLSVIANEEEYEHFKLRTPDDERSSDSGFRDKGSLSESVEDGCEGKYNLEDIEAELEEAFVKGVFGNRGKEKEKDFIDDTKNFNNFDCEESKFYEDGNKNEDFSDIDGEIEFWHTKDDSDYYPEISEFHPSCSQGWYLHPPDEGALSFQRNINEDIVNALRNELRESLPIQGRSFEEFDDFYEADIEDAKRNLNIHYGSEFGLPLSPILEEQNSSNMIIQKNMKNSLFGSGRVKNRIVKLMESVKAVDTNTFMQYLDYMIENEGRDLNELEETEEDIEKTIENRFSPVLIVSEGSSENVQDKWERVFEMSAIGNRDAKVSSTDSLKVDMVKDDAASIEKPDLDFLASFDNTLEQKYDCLEVSADNSENDGLVFTPEMLSPDRGKSLSEISQSSNETHTGDALSEVTLSSPDLVPDCFSSSALEIISHNEETKTVKELNDFDSKSKYLPFDRVIISQDSVNENSELSDPPSDFQRNDDFSVLKPKTRASSNTNKTLNLELNKIEFSKSNLVSLDLGNMTEANNPYEMTTSFMGGDDEEENTILNLKIFDKNEESERIGDKKSLQDLVAEDSYTADWQSESSEGEEMFSSSSSEEFIWKDGNKEAKIKAACASDFVTEHSLFETAQNDPNTAPRTAIQISDFQNKKDPLDEEDDDADNDDDGNESSTGSSASITDFVPSAWNSQATPRRPVLRSPDKKVEKQKKNVWFKKQKYHCVYEYPREPSDNEDPEGSSSTQSGFDKNVSETPIKHFNFGVNTVELPNHHFPYGISKVIDYSSYTDWDVVEAEDPDPSLTDTDSESGSGKTDLDFSKKSDASFYNLSPFDYDFNTTDMNEGKSEFVVSSSSRPFQKSTSVMFSPENSQSEFSNTNSDLLSSKDFVTPDSGIEDSSSVTPSEKVDFSNENVLAKVADLTYPKADIMNILDNLKFNFASEVNENDHKEIDFESFGDKAKFRNGFPNTDDSSVSLTNNGLGELRHTRSKLRLDLPSNHNSDLGAIINKKQNH